MATPRLIERLDIAIGAVLDPLQRCYLQAERAGAIARLGLLSDARFALAGLRVQNQRRKDPLLSAWISLVEGQVMYFGTLAPQAADKFQRALAFAEAAANPPLQALASAWLAACAFNADDIPAMTRHAVAALNLAEPDEHAARARACVVLADAYRCSGDQATSQTWYLRARTHASADGDSAMVSVMLYNISATRSGKIALDDAFGRADVGLARKALLEADSSTNWDVGTGVECLPNMTALLRAQLLVVLSSYEPALQLFDEHLDRSRDEGMARRGAWLLADRAWCKLHLGRTAEAMADMREAEATVSDQRDADDRAAAYARLARINRHVGLDEAAEALQARADQALAEHEAQQAGMRRALDEAVVGLGHDDK